METHTFNSSTWKAEADGSLSLGPVWSAEQVQGQSRLSSEENYGKPKAGKDIIERSLSLRSV